MSGDTPFQYVPLNKLKVYRQHVLINTILRKLNFSSKFSLTEVTGTDSVDIDTSLSSLGGTLNDLSDVVISSPTVDQFFIYNGTNWNNESINVELQDNKGIANGYCDLDANVLVPLSRLAGIVDANIGAHTSTKITITDKALLNSAIMYNDQSNALLDATNIALGTTFGNMIGTSNTQKLGFWNTTPVVQPAANPNTSGATLAELETEVNELKALLRNVGLMAST